ncbi:MAG: RsmB/NOP family class I SAM-dependent RNA methyltransferase [Sulfolobales archaeon]|nr:RsmB/NOP family class I SAM-dependent RNA methyltransferase [Sulfolobales archaeon]MCX8199316.1 RsmB/NOP family class I SAM-dependent RNA methyltransferase [Sulfolobales archaeon]MDW8170371.1 RsmB/NOP family class I SAM-dependent RNA methyltransferase [Desulfurococcaceae archaeon]
METTPSLSQVEFFLNRLLALIESTHVSYDRAYKITLSRYGVSKWLTESLYRIGYYTVLYYHSLKWLARKKNYGGKRSGAIAFFRDLGFSVRRLIDVINDEASDLSTVKKMGLKYSYPEYVVRELLNYMNVSEVEEYLKSLNDRRVWLRVNLARATVEDALACLEDEGVKIEISRHLNYMLLVKSPKWFKAGWSKCFLKKIVIPQDIASAWVVEVVKSLKPVELIDACSAPGVKLCNITSFSYLRRAVACDVSRKRILNIYKLLEFTKAPAVKTLIVNTDSSKASFSMKADLALIDAPCSGSGAISSDPAVKISISREEKLNYYSEIQLKILKNMIKYADLIVYSVCSLHPAEGELIVEKLVEEGLVELIKLENLPLRTAYRGFSISSNSYRTYPHRDLSQAFYIAILKPVKRPLG